MSQYISAVKNNARNSANGVQQLELHLHGDWRVDRLTQIRHEVDTLSKKNWSRDLLIDGADLNELDVSSAYMLVRFLRMLEKRHKAKFAFRNFSDIHARLLNVAQELRGDVPVKPKGQYPALFVGVGQAASEIGNGLYEFIAFCGAAFATLFQLFLRPERVRLTSVFYHINEVGVRAVPIVALMSFLISVVIGYQSIVQLNQFGAQIYTVDLVAISMLRELAVLVTAIMVAGRSGSAFTAELGVMKTNEEVDALRTMGLNIYEVLVLPRLIAIIIALPLLTVVADFAGLIGGYVMSLTLLDLSYDQFMDRLHQALKLKQFWIGLFKAPFFAFLIGVVGCLRGLQVRGAADQVGKYTTRAVVDAIFLVITADALFSILFSYLDL